MQLDASGADRGKRLIGIVAQQQKYAVAGGLLNQLEKRVLAGRIELLRLWKDVNFLRPSLGRMNASARVWRTFSTGILTWSGSSTQITSGWVPESALWHWGQL